MQDLENENINLIDRVTDLKAENQNLLDKIADIEKSYEKHKKFHRKFVDDVVETERIRIDDFKKEKRSLIDENKSLVGLNRQLAKDATFYKKSYEELANESAEIRSHKSTEASAEKSTELYEEPTPSSFQTQTKIKNKSSKSIAKISESLFLENKKLKVKVTNLTADIRLLKKKNQQLENFRKKINNKDLRKHQEYEELEWLVALSTKKNKETFNPEMLAKLDALANN